MLSAPTVAGFNTWGLFYDLPTSFFQASIGSVSLNSTICLGNVSVLNESSYILYQQNNLKLYDKMGTTLKSMMQAVYPVTYACYFSMFEYLQVVQDYFETVLDVNKLFYNLVHNMGNIYDDIEGIIQLVLTGDAGERDYWQ